MAQWAENGKNSEITHMHGNSMIAYLQHIEENSIFKSLHIYFFDKTIVFTTHNYVLFWTH